MSGNFHSRWGGQDYCYLPFIFRTIRNMIQFKESFKITGGGGGSRYGMEISIHFIFFLLSHFDGFLKSQPQRWPSHSWTSTLRWRSCSCRNRKSPFRVDEKFRCRVEDAACGKRVRGVVSCKSCQVSQLASIYFWSKVVLH